MLLNKSNLDISACWLAMLFVPLAFTGTWQH
ncbi:hypothetical protein C7M52_04066 [Mixta theicola]|nr:hypothetical protein C7M52_04066 [Mixta theicola]